MSAFFEKSTKRILLLLIYLSTISCSKTPDPNAMEKFELVHRNVNATFNISASYKSRNKVNNLLVFRLKYPSMEPLDPDGMPQPDGISVYIQLFERQGSTERMVSEALSHVNPARTGHEYRAGSEGRYELYRHIRGRGESAIEVTNYVFKANDGALVGVEDPGSWSGSYEAVRKMEPNLHIKYLVAKPLGRDFILIDERVTAFIDQHIEKNPK
jgi:hypothetical protein